MNILLHCTKSILDRWHIKDAPKIESLENLPLWNSWYCNLLKIGKLKFYLFTHSTTLLSFLLMENNPKEPQNKIEAAFKHYLKRTLELENIPDSKIEPIIGGMNGILISKTNSKKILGTMNEIAFNYIALLTRPGNSTREDFENIVRMINTMPMTALNRCSPNIRLKDLFQ